MTKTKTGSFRSRLEKERTRIQSELGQLMVVCLPDAGAGRSPSTLDDEAGESTELEKRTAIAGRLKASLSEVERALQKVDMGTYGLCERCKKEINPARLEALPQATLCLDCKHKIKPEKGLSRVNEYWNEVMPFYNSLND